MASGRKQKPTNDLMMMRPGLRAQIPDSPSLSPTNYVNSGYENNEILGNSCYEDLDNYNQITFPRKSNNAIYQPTTPSIQPTTPSIPPKRNIQRERQFTECSDDSTSSLVHSHPKDSRAIRGILGLILFMSLSALVLVILMIYGIVGPKCGCDSKPGVNTQKYLTRIDQPSVSTSTLFEIIKRLEKNVSSLVAKDVINQKEILQLKSKFSGLLESSQGESNTNNFKQNITTEVRKLRDKQVQLDLSLNTLQQNDKTKAADLQEMSAKFVGLAVAVNFLSLNDSLIKSKVHDLSLAEVKFRSSLESLKQKDVELDTSLQRAKSVETFLNSSVSQLKSVDGQLKTKLDKLNATILRKINSMNGMQRRPGPPGSPGPQGPKGIPGTPGAGNLSQCQHIQKKVEAAPGPSGKGLVYFTEAKNKKVLGATCSTTRGDDTNLSSVTNSKGEKVYSCECRGQSNVHNDSGQMKCFIDVWVCPRIS